MENLPFSHFLTYLIFLWHVAVRTLSFSGYMLWIGNTVLSLLRSTYRNIAWRVWGLHTYYNIIIKCLYFFASNFMYNPMQNHSVILCFLNQKQMVLNFLLSFQISVMLHWIYYRIYISYFNFYDHPSGLVVECLLKVWVAKSHPHPNRTPC